jgi:hypothetical protein
LRGEATINQAGHLTGTLLHQPSPATGPPRPAPAVVAAVAPAPLAVPPAAPAVVDIAKLQFEFNTAMVNMYAWARDEAGCKATVFLRMVTDHGGLGACGSPKPSHAR